MNWKLFLKKFAVDLLCYTGLMSLIRDINRNNLILGYHRVLPKNSDDIHFIEPGMYVTTESFKRHMSYISRHYNITSLASIIEPSESRNACAITFDDGWYDNYTYAFPTLQRYNIPATVFLTTSRIGTNEWPWPDKISYYVHKASEKSLQTFSSLINSELNMYGERLPKYVLTSKDRKSIAEQYITALKELKDTALCTLMTRIDKSMADYQRMLYRKRSWLTWEEVKEMARHGISFGSHTHSHTILTNTNLKQVIEELRLSKDIIKDNLGKEVDSFSYPNGNYNAQIIDALRKQGYKIAVTTQLGVVNESDNPLTLKRILIHDDVTNTTPLFACKIINWIPFL